MRNAPDDSEAILHRAAHGDPEALAEVFSEHRPRLRAMVRLRLDRRLQGRVDPSDVLQEAYLDLVEQLPGYLAEPRVPFFLWLRLLTGQRLSRVHRQHLGAAMRDAGREVSIQHGAIPEASNATLAERLLGRFSSASQAALRSERRAQLQAALDQLDPIDREIIALRNFEELSNHEVAVVLGLSRTAASNRYVRALARLQKALEAVPGFLDR